MRAFFLLFGLLLGLYAGFCKGIISVSLVSILSVFILLLSINKKQVLWYLIAFSIGFVLMFFIQPLSDGEGVFNCFVVKAKENYVICICRFRKVYVSCKENTYQFGDIITVKGDIKSYVRITYESQFNSIEYFHKLGVDKEIINPSIENVFLLPFRFNEYKKVFLSNFDNETSSLISSVLFNRKDYDSEIISLADEIGIISLISSSGIIARIMISRIRSFLGRFMNEGVDYLCIFLEVILVILSPYKIGLLKILILDLLLLLNKTIFKKRFDYLTLLCVTGMIIILMDFYNAFQISFIISFIISFTIYLFKTNLNSGIELFKKIKTLCLVYAILLPFIIYMNNGNLNILSFILSQLFIPLVVLFSFISFISFFTVPFTHVLGFLSMCIKGIFKGAKFISLEINLGEIKVYFVFIYIIILYIVLFLIQIRFVKLRNTVILSSICCFVVSLLPIVNCFTGEVCFINVGQGDSILIRDRFNTVLIDTGGVTNNDLARNSLIPFFKKRKIYRINYLIITHSDFDHSGAKDSLIKNFNVKNVIESKDLFPLSIGKLYFENLNTFEGTTENEKSLVLSLDFIGKKWIFTGDADKEIEKKIIKYYPYTQCDILKVGHHGSSTSTCDEFLDFLTPSEAVISVGGKNKYGHPTEDVINRLSSRNIKIRRTDLEGTIIYSGFC
ncbi:MAG: ComEC/Rec2 family competence protein [Bacilli bacterium]|nr:ComEC/Rec2 family competence protein [Bacilli bacterium]